MPQRLLLLSSSRKGQEEYLQHAQSMLKTHFQDCNELLFIPYAGVTISWDDYTAQVERALPWIKVKGIHQFEDPSEALEQASALAVGGGNTFRLLSELYQQKLIPSIQQKVATGMPYAGWSAGSNIAGQTIRTTNDMPIVQPPSFTALNLLPIQINPHYSDYQPPGHNGETRAQRLQEFLVLNPQSRVIALREGSALLRHGDRLTLIGDLDGIEFTVQGEKCLTAGADLSELLTG